MTGTVFQRGKSWRIKYDLPADPVTGERRQKAETVRGTKRDAQRLLRQRLTEIDEGSFVVSSKQTLNEYAQHWLDNIAPAKVGAKTLERYREMVEKHIARIGDTPLQQLSAAQIDTFYAHLRENGRLDGTGGLAPLTCLHIHRVLSQILKSAVKAGALRTSPMEAVQTTPKASQEEIQVLDDDELQAVLAHFEGRSLYMPVLLAVSTGMRRGEVLALRWQDIDMDAGTLKVAQTVEQTKAGISIKPPKTDRSRRTITLSQRLVSELRAHKRRQAEWRLKLGIGKDDMDLVFPSPLTGGLMNPRGFTKSFSREMKAAGLGHVTFHGLRHTHITHLLRDNIPVHVVSARAGHKNPVVTLNVYSHLLSGQDADAAAVFDARLTALLDGTGTKI
jgi:integrase